LIIQLPFRILSISRAAPSPIGITWSLIANVSDISEKYGIKLHMIQMGEVAAEKMIEILCRCEE
jgi:hypothetical protein